MTAQSDGAVSSEGGRAALRCLYIAMKKRLIVLFILVAAFMVVLCAAAQADFDPLKVSMTLSENTFTEPKQITVSIKISNTGESDMPGPVTLYYPNGKQVEEFGSPTLTVGTSQSWTGKWHVTQAELEAGRITFKMKYTIINENGEPENKTKNFSKKITYMGGVASVEVNRAISPTTAGQGMEVSITYDVVNTGTLDITDVVITEDRSISRTAGKIPVIKAGEKGTYTFKVTMGKKDLTSKATISYKADGREYSVLKEATTVKYGEMNLSASLSADKKGGLTGDTVKLTLRLKNSGDEDYQNVVVSDPTLGDLFTDATVPAHETVTLEQDLAITETTDYQFTVTAQDASGAEVQTTTERVTVTAIEPSQVVSLSVEARADREVIYELPGIVHFTVAVTNNATAEERRTLRGSHTLTAVRSADSSGAPPGLHSLLSAALSGPPAGSLRGPL